MVASEKTRESRVFKNSLVRCDTRIRQRTTAQKRSPIPVIQRNREKTNTESLFHRANQGKHREIKITISPKNVSLEEFLKENKLNERLEVHRDIKCLSFRYFEFSR